MSIHRSNCDSYYNADPPDYGDADGFAPKLTVVTADDFRSVDYAGADGPRKADGSLPLIEYMHLAQGSDLIDAGVNLGMPFAGSAPIWAVLRRD